MFNSLTWNLDSGNGGRPPASKDRLDTWKEIAGYLKREVRTVQRWEKEEGLPIHRHLHRSLPTVYAYRRELDGWWHRKVAGERPRDKQRTISRKSYHLLLLLLAASIALTFVALGWSKTAGRWNRPADSSDTTIQPSLSVLLAKLDNRTGDSLVGAAFQHTLIEALEEAQMRIVQPATRPSEAQAHARWKLEEEGVSLAGLSTQESAPQVALHCQLMRTGSTFLFRVEISDPSLEASTVTISRTAGQRDQILPTLVMLAKTVTEALSLQSSGNGSVER